MGFELPPGDPDALLGALGTIGSVSGDLKTQGESTRRGFAQALATWKGPRADDFRGASAGLQLQVSEAQSTLDRAVADLDGYARVLKAAIAEIRHLESQAHHRRTQADSDAASLPSDSVEATQIQQHAAQAVGLLESQAEEERQKVRRAAAGLVGVLNAGTALAVPGGEKLSAGDLARRVHQMSGVDGISRAIAAGTLTGPQAWAALDTPSKALKPEEINTDGSIDWKKLADDVREQEKEDHENPAKALLDGSLDAWTLATAPTGGWALARLAIASRNFALAKAALPLDVMKLSQAALDEGRILETPAQAIDSVEGLLTLTDADVAAFQADAALSSAAENVVRSGLPEVLDGTVGKLFVGLGFLGDGLTLADPHSATDDKWDAGVNAAGLAMTTETGSTLVAGGLEATGLVAADAAVGWVPVVGWGLVAVTAGYEVYKHWDTVKSWGVDAWHGTEWVAGKAWDGISSAASGAEHGLEDAAKATGNFISDHLPHISLW